MSGIDLWKVAGLMGTCLFATRWGLQYLASRRARRSVVPAMFWVTSLAGSSLLILYFAASPHRDLVGLLGNAFPAIVAGYNLQLILRSRHEAKVGLTHPVE